MLNLLDDTPVIPGDTRPQFEHGNQARQILNDAEEDLRDWRLETDEVPLASHMLDRNLMPTGANERVANTSYEEEDTVQTINDSQQRNQGTYLPHGTTILDGGSASRGTDGAGGSANEKARPAFVENVDTPNVTVERADVV
jgi:hypothetical protein